MDKKRFLQDLLDSHSRGARYSCYPSHSNWNGEIKEEVFNRDDKVADIYCHIPFCQKLCTFCGCNIFLTNDDELKEKYIDTLIEEWKIRTNESDFKVRNFYIGGGTPNSLSPDLMEKLLSGIEFQKAEDFYSTIELDPRKIERSYLEVLAKYGVSKISLGVQDFNSKVLENVNRGQTFEEIQNAIQLAKDWGISIVNLDFIYGLPHQTKESLSESLKLVEKLSPSTITFYPLAKVPWLSAHQQAFGDFSYSEPEIKYSLLVEGDKVLRDIGYFHIGMGLYVKKDEKIEKLYHEKKLYRGISGYRYGPFAPLIGLGVSAISQGAYQIKQNPKVLDQYLLWGKETFKKFVSGHYRTTDELVLHNSFQDLCCGRHLEIEKIGKLFHLEQNTLGEFINRGWIKLEEDRFSVTDYGTYFLRRICQEIDPLNH